jgi:purine-binding chemotaxis protein CheW
VVDLRLTFGMSRTEQIMNTCIIITEVTVDGDTTILGALSDSVQEVIDFGADHIEPATKIGTRLNTEIIKGMGRQNDRFVIILESDKIFSVSELAQVQVESPVGTGQ